jgi:3-deoxy-D-manno-octulosonate 8-phosphate phosphatase (KDO 8-P phosphatase)
VAFIGDDIPDIPILKVCGLAVCPSDAVAEVKEVCDFVSLYPGGKGCARDLIEQVLKVQNRWIFDCQAYSG